MVTAGSNLEIKKSKKIQINTRLGAPACCVVGLWWHGRRSRMPCQELAHFWALLWCPGSHLSQNIFSCIGFFQISECETKLNENICEKNVAHTHRPLEAIFPVQIRSHLHVVWVWIHYIRCFAPRVQRLGILMTITGKNDGFHCILNALWNRTKNPGCMKTCPHQLLRQGWWTLRWECIGSGMAGSTTTHCGPQLRSSSRKEREGHDAHARSCSRAAAPEQKTLAETQRRDMNPDGWHTRLVLWWHVSARPRNKKT